MPLARAVPRRCRTRPCNWRGALAPRPRLQRAVPGARSLSFLLRPIEERVCSETERDFAVSFRVGSRFVPEPLKVGGSVAGTCSTIRSRSEPRHAIVPVFIALCALDEHFDSRFQLRARGAGEMAAFSGGPSSTTGSWCGLTFELRQPARRAAFAPRRTMEPATALRGAKVARLVGSPLERGVRRHCATPLWTHLEASEA